MSRVFDIAEGVYRKHIRKHVPDGMLAELFAQVLAAMHSANHRVPSADGIFEGDGLNHDTQLIRATERLEKYLDETADSGPPEQRQGLL